MYFILFFCWVIKDPITLNEHSINTCLFLKNIKEFLWWEMNSVQFIKWLQSLSSAVKEKAVASRVLQGFRNNETQDLSGLNLASVKRCTPAETCLCRTDIISFNEKRELYYRRTDKLCSWYRRSGDNLPDSWIINTDDLTYEWLCYCYEWTFIFLFWSETTESRLTEQNVFLWIITELIFMDSFSHFNCSDTIFILSINHNQEDSFSDICDPL